MSSPGREAGLLDGLDEQLHGLLVARRGSGAKPPSSPTAVDRPRSCSTPLERVVGLGAPAQRLGEAGRADRHDHELLEVDVVVGVRAAVEHVHHRHRAARGRWRRRRSGTAAGSSSSAAALATASDTPRMALAPRRPLLSVPSRSMQQPVDVALVERVEADQGVGDLAVDVADGVEHALAAVAVAAVAELDRLELRRWTRPTARRPGPRRRSRGRPRPRRWGCRGVEDLPADDVLDGAHDAVLPVVRVESVTAATGGDGDPGWPGDGPAGPHEPAPWRTPDPCPPQPAGRPAVSGRAARRANPSTGRSRCCIGPADTRSRASHPGRSPHHLTSPRAGGRG